MAQKFSLFLMLFFITGCLGSEPTSANLEAFKQTNNSNMAQHIFTRDYSAVGMVLKVNISINGRKIGGMRPGQSISAYAPAGSTVIVAEMLLDGGKFTINGNSEPGKTYRYKVTANNNNWKQALCGLDCTSGGSWKVIPKNF
tara:strand:- start:170 stop:595 length:426 start_codon:yes stop_codon:yes gene_type:complete